MVIHYMYRILIYFAGLFVKILPFVIPYRKKVNFYKFAVFFEIDRIAHFH